MCSILICKIIGLNGERGQGTAILWYSQKDKTIPIPIQNDRKYKTLVHNTAIPERNTFAYTFDDIEASSLAISGGKGASLALLQSVLKNNLFSLDYCVPAGFVLSVSAFDLQIQRYPDLKSAINAVKKAAYSKNLENLEKACKT